VLEMWEDACANILRKVLHWACRNVLHWACRSAYQKSDWACRNVLHWACRSAYQKSAGMRAWDVGGYFCKYAAKIVPENGVFL